MLNPISSMNNKRKRDQQNANQTFSDNQCTPSEQEILADLPPPGVLRAATTMRRPSAVSVTYLIYAILQANVQSSPQVVVRKSYESLFEALEAFRREYRMWMSGTLKTRTGLFPAAHTEQQLSGPYLINLMEMNKKKDAASTQTASHPAYNGRAKIEYAICHRDDVLMDDDNSKKRKCTIICEEVPMERAS